MDKNVFFRAIGRLRIYEKGQNRAARWRNYSGHCTRYELHFPLLDVINFNSPVNP